MSLPTRKLGEIKNMKKITILLIACLLCNTMLMLGFTEEKWQSNLKKDFAKVLKEKKKPAEKHRQFIIKWQKAGHLDAVLMLYEAEKENTPTINAAFYYGLGYAHAMHATETDSSHSRKPGLAFNLDTAVTYFQHALEMDPGLFWAHFNLGGIYQQRDENALALAAFETCLRLNPSYYPVYYRMGEIHLKQQNYAEARHAFETAQKLNRKWEYPRYGIGLVHFAQGKLNLARETFENLIQQKKKFAPAYFKLGQVLATEGFFDAALEEYAKGATYQPYSAEELYELAVIFTEKGNTDGAIQLYQRTLELEVDNAEAHFALGDLLYTQGDTATARQHYQQAIAITPSLKDAFYEPLEPYFAGLMTADEAKSILEKAKWVLPADARSHFYAGTLEVDAGNIQAAITHYQKTLEIITAEPSYLEMALPLGHFNDVYLKLGELYHQQGDVEAAVGYFERALELNPALADMFITQGQNAFDAGNYSDAIEPLNTHLLLFPEDSAAAYLLGQSYEANGDIDNALLFYQRTLALDAKRADVLFKIVHIYREQQAHPQAVEALQKIIALEPDTAEAHYLLALSQLALNEREAALSAFLETVRLTPDNVAAQYQAGILFEQKGDIDNAIVHYEKTIALDETNAEPFFRLGAIYRERNDEDNILRVYQPALALEPAHPKLHHLLAVIFEKRDEPEHAIHYYGLANQYDPGHFDWHYSYARLLDRYAETLGDDYHTHAEMAVNEYTTTITLNSAYADAYFYRGLLTLRYKQIGKTLYRYSQILEDFKQVAELQPKNADADYHVGVIYVEIDRHRLAKAVFEKMRAYAPQYKGVYLHLGQIAEWEQDWKQAIKHYEAEVRLIDTEQGDRDEIATKTYQRLGALYYAHALDYNAAKETLEKALALDTSHVPTLLNYANNLFSMDSLGAATEQFERVLQLEPGNLTANYNLALMYEYREKREQAIAQWKRFLELNPPEQWKIEAERHLRELRK